MTEEQQRAEMQRLIVNSADVTCENCGNYTFTEVLLMKRISALVSPSGKETLVPIPVIACNACGNVIPETVPSKVMSDAPVDKISLVQ